MKTAKERAFELVNQIIEGFKDDLIRRIELALKEQDKLTRHACADSAGLCYVKEIARGGHNAEFEEVYAAIMNTKAV